MNPIPRSIEELKKLYESKQTQPEEVVEVLLKRSKALDAQLNLFIELDEDRIRKRAKQLKAEISRARELPLFGVPIGVKDILHLEGWQTTAGSKILEGYRAPFSATAVDKMEKAGAIVFGKLNLDEFAMGSSTENSAYGSTRNPWNFDCVPGGSSGGSAAAVAAQAVVASLGTDTGGSIRQPASLCGIVGLKPTYGRVSRYGVVGFASSLDQVGPFGWTCQDAARVFEVIAGQDPNDLTTSAEKVPDIGGDLDRFSMQGVKIGVPRKELENGVDEDVLKAFNASLSLFEKQGAKIVNIELPHSKYSLSVYYILATSEASSNLARYDGVHLGYRSPNAKMESEVYEKSRGEGFGLEVKLRILLGTYALSAGYYQSFYAKANAIRKKLAMDYRQAFKNVQAIATPTSPTTAFKFGEKSQDPIQMYLSDLFTLSPSLAGIPGVSIPCGMDSKNLPIGLQLVAPHFQEKFLMQLGNSFEKARGPFGFPQLGGVN